jgi:ABC-type uncharacterized transport system involved in gliding motility auxiliary subunit
MHTKTFGWTGLILGAALFLGVNIIGNETLTGWRLDLSHDRLFTLATGTRNILNEIGEPITLRFYFSARQFAAIPQYLNHGKRVRDLLDEFVARSHGKIKLHVIDPEPFSEAEDQAVAFGIQQLPVTAAGEMAYIGLVGTNSVDNEELIPFLSPDREQALEYDITKMIYALAKPKKRVIGAISGLPMFGMPGMPMAGIPGGQAWMIANLLRETFDVRELASDTASVDADIDTLLLVHPKDLPEKTLFAIDQFILRGGKAMIFVDPLAEEARAQPDPGNPMAMPDPSSDLPRLFEAWGINMPDGKVAGDPLTAVRVRSETAAGPQAVDYLPWLGLRDANLNRDDFATSALETVNVGSAGMLEISDGAPVTANPLISTSPRAATIDSAAMMFGTDPAGLLANFTPGDKPLVLAARLQGTVKTAFPDGPPPDDAEEEKPDAAAGADYLRESNGPINVVVVADTDILADRFWVDVQSFLGMQIPSVFADNANFVINVLEMLGGSNDLISLRSRGQFSRPFDRVQAIRRDAEMRFRDQERALQAKLEDTEKALAELQSQKDADSTLLLTEEQRAAIERFRADQLETRRQLRTVQHDLQKDIERLGTTLKFINIGLVPLIIVVGALFANGLRTRRRVAGARPL